MAESRYAAVRATPLNDLAAYADALRRASRGLPAPLPDAEWMALYDSGLRAAIRAHDVESVAALVGVLVNRFDGAAQWREAIAHLRQVLALVTRDSSAALLVLSLTAKMEAALGDFPEARSSLAAAGPLARHSNDTRAWSEFRSSIILLNCTSLHSLNLAQVESAIGALASDGDDALSSLCVSWFIPYLVAIGESRVAMPWAHWLAVTAAEYRHPWRAADAAMFEWSLGAADDPHALVAPDPFSLGPANWIAPWRISCHQMRAAIVRGDWNVAVEIGGALKVQSTGAYPGYRSMPAAGNALIAAYRGEVMIPLELPAEASLFNLPAVLAMIEATAIAGAQADAQSWVRWCAANLPRRVETSLEWPVSRRRVEGLLRLRAGDVRGGVELLHGAVTWADQAGYPTEAAIAGVQLAEVTAHAPAPQADRAIARQLGKAGWAALLAAGLDPVPHAYAATRAARLDVTGPSAVLSPREVEVLQLLADGLSYRETGMRLDMSWRTAQSHAYHIYEKLGVSRRLHAIARAQEIGILPPP